MIFYNKNSEIIEIIVRDFSGAKIESYKFNCNDTKTANNILSLLKKKYGFSPSIMPDEHINNDIDWLKKVD
jgi:hypothetical protein